jgi:branched-chain amino acid transport system ATP-binding protein
MLQIKNLNAAYGEVRVLHDVSFYVNKGEVVGLVGANGAGKSTTLKVLSGLLPPVGGEVFFESKDITKISAYKIVEQGIAHVPEGRRLFPLMTVTENLEMGSFLPEPKKSRQETMDMVFELFPILKERKSQLAGTLSGGEQQMLAIARGLMSKPKLLMLDEASLGLAPVLVEKIYGMIEQIRKQEIAILLVEQNVHLCLNFVDRAYVLENGRVVLDGKGKDLLANEYLKKAYLGL